ncbi:transglutaminase TgpA family protein [Natronocalculus amylovorans]|uniref:DUF3488 and transglutaminase-like domain-containing protein n=1 Tax=Natronocalculus amylovorans TaxID=2917812 RepID=A0AAE3K8M2_9EURY|nr:DUF3488 and transglutaminase-like domain-containing protein [Natronocalculus amylovorans]MCL9817467.1 DUF3488 and transglutaminase-like domain-containing protein [Natronocalculus amylovorans]
MIALTCLLALGLLAVSFTGGATLGAPGTGDETDTTTAAVERVDHPGLVGGGSLGGAAENPIGTGVANESNPFTNSSDELQFVVETTQPSYWRVDGYTTYENGTWVRTGDSERYSDTLAATGRISDEVSHQITLTRQASAAPTSWQPATIENLDDVGVDVSSETGLLLVEPTPIGRNYTVETYQYEPDLQQLRSSQENYPASIRQQYTALPDDLPDRISVLGDELTEETETPVEAACEIESWIQDTHDYDRSVTHDEAGADPIEQYLFEMDAGNAEYAASSMVVLLRSQGIPARYVTGYAPGAIDGDGTYTVHSVHSHAWVEVYVTGHGWIPFDPTDPADRMAVESDALGPDTEMADVMLPSQCGEPIEAEEDEESTQDDDTDDTEDGSGGTEDGSTNQTEENEEGDSEEEIQESELEITVSVSPEPLVIGGDATIGTEIENENDSLSGATVMLNESVVGVTNDSGGLEFTVPSSIDEGETTLRITDEDREIDHEQTVTVGELRLTSDSEEVLALPGQNISVITTVGEEPVENATIAHDGSTLAQTDSDGVASIPISATGVTVSAEYVGQSVTLSVTNQFLLLTGLGVFILILGTVGTVLSSRESDTISTAQTRISGLSDRIEQRLINAIAWIEATLTRPELRTETSLGAKLWWVVTAPMVLLRAVWKRRPDSIVSAIWTSVYGFYTFIRGLFGRGTEAETDPTSENASDRDSTGSSDPEAQGRSIGSIWRSFIRVVFGRISPNQTAGELAQQAIQKGFPREPVIRITTAFREAVYGPRRDGQDMTEAATALSAIEQSQSEETE